MPGSQEPLEAFAITAPGLSRVAAREMADIGLAVHGVEPAGVTFKGGLHEVYAANLRLRTVSRVIVRLATFQARTFAELERGSARIAWSRFMAPGRRFDVRVTSRKSRLYHSDAVAERVARAIVESAGAVEAGGDVAEDHEGEAAQLVIVRIDRDECTVNMDSSGALLHMRGYRRATAKAPMRETIAAAMLLACEWRGREPLLDPFCGSGTIPIEGAMIARGIAPGLDRVFGFQQWPWAEAGLWARMKRDAESEIRDSPSVAIMGSDRDEGAIRAATENAARARVEQDIELVVSPVSEANVDGPPGWIVTNPPYGVRVGTSRELRNLYARFGTVVRERFEGWRVAFLSADHALEAQMRMQLEVLFRTTNGGIPVRCMTLQGARVGGRANE